MELASLKINTLTHKTYPKPKFLAFTVEDDEQS